MKKIIIYLFVIVAGIACNRYSYVDDFTQECDSDEDRAVVFNLSVSIADSEAETKALKSTWESGDKVYVFVQGIAKKYILLTYNEDKWEVSFPQGVYDYDALESNPYAHKMTAVYIPFYDGVLQCDAYETTFQSPVYTYYMSSECDYTFQAHETATSRAVVSANITLSKPDGFVQFFIPNIDEADVPLYKLRESHLQPKAIKNISTSGGISLGEKNEGYALGGFPYNGGILFAGYLTTAGTEENYSFELVKINSVERPFALGTFVAAKNKTIESGVVVRFPDLSSSSWIYYQWVDLGVGVKWATGNLAGNSILAPEQTSMYYAWGETVGHYIEQGYNFNSTNYKYTYESTGKYTKYCSEADDGYNGFTDWKTQLDPSDDAAYVGLGGRWRIPTKEEAQALVNSASFVWNGYTPTGAYRPSAFTCTSKVNGLQIILPRMGYIQGTTNMAEYDSRYRYITSTLDPNNDSTPWELRDGPHMAIGSRLDGLPIRPVWE